MHAFIHKADYFGVLCLSIQSIVNHDYLSGQASLKGSTNCDELVFSILILRFFLHFHM